MDRTTRRGRNPFPAGLMSLFAAVLLALAGCGTGPDTRPDVAAQPADPTLQAAREHRKAAAAHLAQGNNDLARKEVNKAIALAPRDAEAYVLRSLVRYNDSNILEAINDAGKAVEIAPGNPDAHDTLGYYYLQARQYGSARSEFDRAVAINPRHTSALAHRGRLYTAQEQTEKALADFEAVLAIDPGHAEALLGKGDALAQAGRPREAIAAYDQYLRHIPPRKQKEAEAVRQKRKELEGT